MRKRLEIRDKRLGVWWLGVGTLLLVFNQLTTFVIKEYRPGTILINKGVIFGSVHQPLVIVAVILIGFFLVARIITAGPKHPLFWGGLTLILVGALSNILDRIMFGGVIDYVSFFGWSTFNLADVEIVIGALLIALPSNQDLRKLGTSSNGGDE